jgi:nicotinamide-nucleotide amidase
MTDVAGSSGWFEAGFVTYSNRAKTAGLGVPEGLIAAEGAVSRAVVEAMARGASERTGAALAVAVSGVAGPGGGSVEKPVGTVWFGFAVRGVIDAVLAHFPGDRDAVRRAAVDFALAGLIERLDG